MPILQRFAHYIPLTLRWNLKRRQFSGNERYCPICTSNVRGFLEAGLHDRRADAKCPVCKSLARHRLAWQFMLEHTGLMNGYAKSLLHIAPEPHLEHNFRRIAGLKYVSADLENPRATLNLDITATNLPDQLFDVIYCSHVLEHVPADVQALRELGRILKPTGWMIIQIPERGIVTIEDFSVTDPQERLKRFGQADHVRIYGSDVLVRFEQAGLQVKRVVADEIFPAQQVTRLSIRGEVLYFCRGSEC